MREGLYEHVITVALERSLNSLEGLERELGKVDEADQPHVLTRHIARALQARLAAIKDPAARLMAANAVLAAIDTVPDPLSDPVQELHALRLPDGPGRTPRLRHRPKTPLNDAALLTNAHGEPSLASELRAEIDSADSIDLLCAFVMWHGLRLIEGELRRLGMPAFRFES